MADKKVKVKIYGERNTGTNYLHKLLESNFHIDVISGTEPANLDRVMSRFKSKEWLRDVYFKIAKNNNLGWKHRELDALFLKGLEGGSADNEYLVLTKNPYSWLLSLYDRPYHYAEKEKGSFNDFLEREWKTLRRESERVSYPNPVDMWNKKNASYIELGKVFDVSVVRYEDLLFDFVGELKKLKYSMSLACKPEYPVEYKKAAKVKDHKKKAGFYQSYYGNEEWRGRLDRSSLGIINEHLDEKVLEFFGYEIIS